MGLREGGKAVDRERQEWQQQNKIVNAVTENWANDSTDTCITNGFRILLTNYFCERLFVRVCLYAYVCLCPCFALLHACVYR